MNLIIIASCALFASLITFYSGFGLGTILTPIIAIFFPLPVAIVLTAIVHLFHNLLKTGLLWKKIDWTIAFYFGIFAMIGSAIGAFLLKEIADIPPLYTYTLLMFSKEISILHLVIGTLLILFATLELLSKKIVKIKNLPVGGLMSGFFGGLSGYQGAFRSLFLIQTKLQKKEFIGTSGLISAFVDIIRLIVYSISFSKLFLSIDGMLLGVTIGGALLGIAIGMGLLKQVTINFIRKGVAILLYLLGFLLAIGII